MTMTNGPSSIVRRTTIWFQQARPWFGRLLICVLFTAGTGYAKDFTVTTPGDGVDANLGDNVCETATGNGVCTLRAAVQQANANGTTNRIILPANLGEIQLTIQNSVPQQSSDNIAATGDLDINSNLTISGAGRDVTVINGGNAQDRVFHVLNGVVAMSDLTIKNGYVRDSVGGGIYLASGTLTLNNVAVTNNTALNSGGVTDGGNGGGIYNSTAGTLIISNSVISGNVSDTNQKGIGGGGIFNAGALRIEDSTIDSNQAKNSASAGGGGIQNQGGTGQDPNVADVTIINTTISSNSAVVGGGVRNLFGTIHIDGATFSGNGATSGGGIENSGGGMFIAHSTVRDNTAGNTGGGIDNFAAMELDFSLVYNNSTGGNSGITPGGASGAGQGGGIYNSGQGAFSMFNTTVTNNSGIDGAGIYNHRAINITNSTIYNNISTNSKPGSEIVACGTKDEGKQLDCSNDSSLVKTTIINSIVGNATGGVACLSAPIPGTTIFTITSGGYNIDLGDTCGFHQTGDKTNIAAGELFVGGLAANGGRSLNYAIRPNSAAHNAGDNIHCPVIDQRDYVRGPRLAPPDNCDIGAYEISPTLSNFELADLKVDVTSNSVTQGGGGQLTFTVTITNKGPNGATNVIVSGKLPPWALPAANGLSTNNGGACTATSTGIRCEMNTINAYTSAQIYVVVFPQQSGYLVLEVEAVSDQVDTFRPDSTTSTLTTASPGSGNNVGGGGVTGNFSGKGGSVDWSWALLLAVPALRLYARRR